MESEGCFTSLDSQAKLMLLSINGLARESATQLLWVQQRPRSCLNRGSRGDLFNLVVEFHVMGLQRLLGTQREPVARL